MRQYRDVSPTYPKLVIEVFAEITFLEEAGADRDVIDCAYPNYSSDMHSSETERVKPPLSQVSA
jgi:phenolic acid decarboxylase